MYTIHNNYIPESIPVDKTLFFLNQSSQARHVFFKGSPAIRPIVLVITFGVSKIFIARPMDECQEK